MIEFIKKLLRSVVKDAIADIPNFKITVDYEDSEFNRDAARIIRHILGSIDLSDVRNIKPKTEEEQRNYDARMASVFFDTGKTADKLIVAQEEHIGMEVMNQEQLMFARGTINGIKLLRDEFEDAKDRHVARNTESHQKFDARELFPELNE